MKLKPGIWQGEEVWIIGGGPSITDQFCIPEIVVQEVRETKNTELYSPYMRVIHDKKVIGVNVAYKLGDWIDVNFFYDWAVWEKHSEGLKSHPAPIVTCNTRFDKPEFKNDVFCFEYNRQKKLGISTQWPQMSWNHSSGGAAINLAVLLGAKRIVLLGFDMHDVEGHTHYHNEYNVRKTDPSTYARFLKGFPQIAKDLKELDIEVVNINKGSAVTQFPELTLKQFIKKGMDIETPVKVGVVTPTCSPERKSFVDFMHWQVCNQSYPVHHHAVIDYPNQTGKPDLTKRYEEGVDQCLQAGCELVFFIEDDDYYPVNYIEECVKWWLSNGRPAIMGTDSTFYYHLFSKGWIRMETPKHSSAHATAVTARATYKDVCPHDNPFYDIQLWRANPECSPCSIENHPISIKHGFGLSGGKGHRGKEYAHRDDAEMGVLQNRVSDVAFQLYKLIIANEGGKKEPKPLTSWEWNLIYQRAGIPKRKVLDIEDAKEVEITQGYVAPMIKQFRFLDRFRLRNTKVNPHRPLVMFGVYENCDRQVIRNHRDLLVIRWAGMDSQRITASFLSVLKQDHIIHITPLIQVKKFLEQLGLKVYLSKISASHIGQPMILGPSIYAYLNHHKPDYHGKQIIDRLNLKHPLLIGDYKIPPDQWVTGRCDEYYGQSFVGLCLSNYAGGGDSIVEMGLRGIPVVTNVLDLPNCIHWQTHDDIMQGIEKASEKIGMVNEQLAEQVREQVIFRHPNFQLKEVLR